MVELHRTMDENTCAENLSYLHNKCALKHTHTHITGGVGRWFRDQEHLVFFERSRFDSQHTYDGSQLCVIPVPGITYPLWSSQAIHLMRNSKSRTNNYTDKLKQSHLRIIKMHRSSS